MSELYEELNDEILVQRGREGDSVAVDHLLTRYKSMVISKTRAFYLVGADKDDLVQEGMIGLFKAIRDFDDTKQCKFGTFAELCVTRQLITAIKAATRRKHSPLNTYISLYKPVYEGDTQTTIGELLTGSDFNPELLVLEEEMKQNMKRMVSDYLSEMEKKVLHYYLKGLSYSEIAEKVGISFKSTDNALQRIKRKLIKAISSTKNS